MQMKPSILSQKQSDGTIERLTGLLRKKVKLNIKTGPKKAKGKMTKTFETLPSQ